MPVLSQVDLEQLLARTTKRSHRELLRAFLRVRQGLPLSELERALVANNLDEAMKTIGLAPTLNALARVQTSAQDLQAAGWFDALRGLPGEIRSNPLLELTLGAAAQTKPEVLEALQRQNLARIRGITQQTEAAIRAELERGLRAGLHPRETARAIRNVIGLNTQQQRSLDIFRKRLEASDRDPAVIERMLERFAQRQLTVRAENIALTETFTALQAGKQAQWDRLVRDGVINATDWEVELVTANDERVCPVCGPLDGVRAPLGEHPGGSAVPLHPRCRCIERLVLKGFRQGDPTNRFRRPVTLAAPSRKSGPPKPPQPRRPATPTVPPAPTTGMFTSDARETKRQAAARVAFETRVRSLAVEHGFVRDRKGGTIEHTDNQPGSISFAPFSAQIKNAPLVVHNHPRGTPFSIQDLRFALGNGVRTVRVIGDSVDGPVSYEMNVGAKARNAKLRRQVLLEAGRIYRDLEPKYFAEWVRLRRTMPIAELDRLISTRHLHELWTLLAQRMGFTYTRRLHGSP